MKNIGPASRQWLAEIEIYTLDDLKHVGSAAAYQFIKARYPKKATLNLLWALEAAIRDIDWRELTEEDKDVLRKNLRGGNHVNL